MNGIEYAAPNWNRFLQKYPKGRHFLSKISERYDRLPEGPAKKRLAELVNLELWMVLLKETEIDEKSFKKLLSAMK